MGVHPSSGLIWPISLTGYWGIFSWLFGDWKSLCFDSFMGQWQVSVTSTPPSSALTLCSLGSKALDAFFWGSFPSNSLSRLHGGWMGTTQALYLVGMHQSWWGKLKSKGGRFKQRRGWKLWWRECPGSHRDIKLYCMECPLAPAVNLLQGLSHISQYEIRPYIAKRASQWSGTI